MTPEQWALQAELLLERLKPAAFACAHPMLASEISDLLKMRRAIDTTPPAPRGRCWVCQGLIAEKAFGATEELAGKPAALHMKHLPPTT